MRHSLAVQEEPDGKFLSPGGMASNEESADLIREQTRVLLSIRKEQRIASVAVIACLIVFTFANNAFAPAPAVSTHAACPVCPICPNCPAAPECPAPAAAALAVVPEPQAPPAPAAPLLPPPCTKPTPWIHNFLNIIIPAGTYSSSMLIGADWAPGTLCIDVGSFNGDDMAAYADKKMKVITIEPTPSKIARIRSRAEPYGKQVEVIHAALSNVTGTANFRVMDGGSEQDSFGTPWAEGESVQVPVMRLDDIIGDQSVGLLKIDTQGHEYGVLMGARKALAERRIRVILMEYGPNLIRANHFDPMDVLNLVYEHGYQCYDMPTNLQPIERPSDFAGFAGAFRDLMWRGVNHGGQCDLVCI